MRYFVQKIGLVTTMLLTVLVAHAYDCEVDGIYYNLDATKMTAAVTYGENKYNGTVVIPTEITYSDEIYNVISIGERAFEYCRDVTSVTFPKTMTSIEYRAFFNCSEIHTVICNAINPPSAMDSSFAKYEGRWLKVPSESVKKYKETSPWNRFLITSTVSGIEGVDGDEVSNVRVDGGEIVVDSGVTVEVYSLTGARVAVTNGGRVSGLPRGIYLVRTGGKTYKVAL